MKIGYSVYLLNTTNVVIKLISSFFVFFAVLILLVRFGFAQTSSDYQEGTGKAVPVVSLKEVEHRTQTVPLTPSEKAFHSILTEGRKVLSAPTSPIPEKEKFVGERITISERTQLVYDERTRAGIVTDRDGGQWKYDHVAIVNAGKAAPPEGYVELGRFVKPGNVSAPQAVYGKPAGAIEEIAIGQDKTFVYDAKTRTGALIAGSEGKIASSIDQYRDVHIVTESTSDCLLAECTESIKDLVIPAGYVAIGQVEEVINILPDNTTIVAKQFIYAKLDQTIAFLMDLKEIAAS